MKTIATTALLTAGTVGCAANSHENASSQPASTSPAGDAAVDVEGEVPLFAVAQYWPGTDRWPPPEPIGPQYWPGTDRWPPPEPIGPQFGPDAARQQTSASTPTASSSVTAADPTATAALDDELAAAVTEAVGTAEAAYDAAMRNPDDPSLRQAVVDATVDGSPAQQELLSSYDDHMAAGRWSEPHPDGVENSVTALEVPTRFDDGLVGVVVCYVNGDQLMQRAGTGVPELVDGSRNARIMLEVFELVDEAWRLESRLEIAVVPEQTSCEPEVSSSSAPPSSGS